MEYQEKYTKICNLIGKPFKRMGRGDGGYDCWGLAQEVYKIFGAGLPDYRIPSMDKERIYKQYCEVKCNYIEVAGELPTPCLVFMRINSKLGNHVGVYLGEGWFIHAVSGHGVRKDRINSPEFRNLIVGYYIPRGEE